ncbi:PUF domain-containing protein, partial [Cephalotus follicularis]
MNRSAISCPNISNDSYADQYNIRANAIRLDSRFQNTRSPRSLSGPESDHVSTVLLSSLLNNHQNAKPQRRPSNYSSLDELKGRLFTVAKEQQGCRFLQHIVEENKPEDIEMIFMEVKEVVHELMVDPVANYLIQKLIEACNEQQMNGMVLSLVCDEEKLMNICGHSHGTRVIQKLLEHVTTREQKSLIISALKCITVTLTKSMHGHHVIQQCFRQFSNEEAKPLLDDIAENCLDIATDKSGCCVLQQCVAHAEGESRERLISEIIPNSLILAEHPYGNYVVQYLLGMKIPRVSENILDQLKGSYVNLSMNKYGSNVVEKCLKECGEKESATITMELINDPGCLKVLLDPYGNYVVQSALSVS